MSRHILSGCFLNSIKTIVEQLGYTGESGSSALAAFRRGIVCFALCESLWRLPTDLVFRCSCCSSEIFMICISSNSRSSWQLLSNLSHSCSRPSPHLTTTNNLAPLRTNSHVTANRPSVRCGRLSWIRFIVFFLLMWAGTLPSFSQISPLKIACRSL